MNPSSGDCDPGYIGGVGATSAQCGTPCDVGKYNNGGSECTLCDIGTYQDVRAQSSCKPCPAGRFGSSKGLQTSLCTGPCDSGTWGGGGDTSSSCTSSCDRGKYSVAGTPAACTDCPEGRYQDETGGGVCKACTQGRYGSSRGLQESACDGACAVSVEE